MTLGVIVHIVHSPYMFSLYARCSTRPESAKINKMFYPLRAHRLVEGENKQINC